MIKTVISLFEMWFCELCTQVSGSKSNVEPAGDEFAPVHAEDMQYTDAKSYIMLEICLHRPLIHKKDTQELAKR